MGTPMTDAEPEPDRTPKPVSAAVARSRARARFNQTMRQVRRIHLYTGLFMTPWVFLYGVSTLLFNHPDAFPDQAVTYFDSADGGAGPFRPDALAGRVVDALNKAETDAGATTAGAGADKAGKPAPFRVIKPEEAEFNRDLFATARGDGREYLVRLTLDDGSSSVRDVTKPAIKPEPDAPKGKLKLEPPPFEAVMKGLPGALKASGVPAKEAFVRAAPDLKFLAEGKGRTWRMSYNGQTGIVSGKPAEVTNVPPSFRRYLILLHVAHGFPSKIGTRWVWAILVDMMFASMVGWGITGIMMWWQMKNVRVIGAYVLLASLITAAVMAVGMHSIFNAEGLS
jgi:hypothetical protein